MAPANLYVHFPFCRRKCSYCALHSRAGVTPARRAAYVAGLARQISDFRFQISKVDAAKALETKGVETEEIETKGMEMPAELETVYFGGGSPALCDLAPLFAALRPLLGRRSSDSGRRSSDSGRRPEFTVELHPLDVNEDLLARLRDGGVNRVSMGVQSLDDAVLADMGRGYTVAEAERAFALVKRYFDNAGIDLIVGYPGTSCFDLRSLSRLKDWGLRHCSVYSLILEENSILAHRLSKLSNSQTFKPSNSQTLKPLNFSTLPSDDEALDGIRSTAAFLEAIGLKRYEISNYAVPGYECRHNLAVWRGEDYIGLGEGAHGRVGLTRTYVKPGSVPNSVGSVPAYSGSVPDSVGSVPAYSGSVPVEVTEVDAATDLKERTIFRLRTREGLDASRFPEWHAALAGYVAEGLLTRNGDVYTLTERGTEVCDSILADLV